MPNVGWRGNANPKAVVLAEGAEIAGPLDANGSVEIVLNDSSGNALEYLTPLSLFSAKGQNALSTTAEEVNAANASRIGLKIKNLDASILVYIGDSNAVTSSNGYELGSKVEITITDYAGPIWMIAASGTPTVAFLEW
jgi:hypothetical protein